MPNFNKIKDKKILILSVAMDSWTEDEKISSLLSYDLLKKQIPEKNFALQIEEFSTSVQLEKFLKNHNPEYYVVFNWCEELDGVENNFEIAPKLLDKYNYIYSGNGAESLELTSDKVKVKKLLVDNGISTPKYLIVNKIRDVYTWDIFPCIVKPAYEHCSYGVTKESVVDTPEALAIRSQQLFEKFHQSLLVEEFINGTEFFVSVWGYEKPEVLPFMSLDYSFTNDYHEKIFSFGAKWDRNSREFKKSEYLEPGDMEPALLRRIKREVIDCYEVTKCEGYARMDLRIKNNIPYILDVNANPDMTVESDFVLATEKKGYNYGETILKLCEIAFINSQIPANLLENKQEE